MFLSREEPNVEVLSLAGIEIDFVSLAFVCFCAGRVEVALSMSPRAVEPDEEALSGRSDKTDFDTCAGRLGLVFFG